MEFAASSLLQGVPFSHATFCSLPANRHEQFVCGQNVHVEHLASYRGRPQATIDGLPETGWTFADFAGSGRTFADFALETAGGALRN